jgi:invasion protein IalB
VNPDRTPGAILTVDMKPKAIQDEQSETFDRYGRLSAKLGIERGQTGGAAGFVVQNFVDPATEILDDGQIQIWKITHNGVDTHPVHFHLFDVQVINRVGWDGFIYLPDLNELGWKDTVRISPLEDTIVALRPVAPKLPFGLPDSVRPLNPSQPIGTSEGFTNLDPFTGQRFTPAVTNQLVNFGWEYVWHCHILSHEEMDMMRPIIFNVDRQIPDPPSSLSANAVGGQINLTWTDPTPPLPVNLGNPKNEIGFRVERATITGGSPGPFAAIGASLANATAFVDSSVSAGVLYAYQVVAYNAAGDSVPSNMIITSTTVSAPTAPTSVTAVAGNAQAVVSFATPISDGGSPILYYTVTSSPGGITATGTSSPITVTGLTNGTTYTFTVTATNAIGTGPASAPSNAVTPATVPEAPTGVSAVAGNGQATVSFTAPVSDGGSPITSYTVTSSPGGITATGTSSPITVTGLANGTTYTFTVTATNVIGIGPASAPSNPVTPATVPEAPTGVSAVAGNGQATVSFTAPASDGGSPITSYTVTSSPGGITAMGSTSPITVTGLTNGTTYTFTVTATNAIGTGPASAPSNAVTPLGLPGAPTGVSAVAGNGQATVSFTAPASDGGSPITFLHGNLQSWRRSRPTASTSPITVTGLTNGTTYTFTVTATNAIGTGPASAPSNAVMPQGPPGAPSFAVAVAGNGQATVYFGSPASDGGSPITSYTVTSSPGGITATGSFEPNHGDRAHQWHHLYFHRDGHQRYWDRSGFGSIEPCYTSDGPRSTDRRFGSGWKRSGNGEFHCASFGRRKPDPLLHSNLQSWRRHRQWVFQSDHGHWADQWDHLHFYRYSDQRYRNGSGIRSIEQRDTSRTYSSSGTFEPGWHAITLEHGPTYHHVDVGRQFQ